jgi:hypothetical protein
MFRISIQLKCLMLVDSDDSAFIIAKSEVVLRAYLTRIGCSHKPLHCQTYRRRLDYTALSSACLCRTRMPLKCFMLIDSYSSAFIVVESIEVVLCINAPALSCCSYIPFDRFTQIHSDVSAISVQCATSY